MTASVVREDPTPTDEVNEAILALTEGGEPLTREVIEPLVRLLRHLGEDMRQRGAVEGSASKAVHPTDFVGLGTPREDWTAALAVARAIRGRSS